jgi:hypothetical protein
VVILIKRGEIIGASLKRILSDYKKMLNSNLEKELFCAVLTHCDSNIDFDGEPVILDTIKHQGISTLVSNEHRERALAIYNDQFTDDI